MLNILQKKQFVQCNSCSNKIFWRNIIRNRRLSKSIFRSNTKINRKIRKKIEMILGIEMEAKVEYSEYEKI